MSEIVTRPLANLTAAGTQILFKAPADGFGGGVTINEAWMASSAGTVANAFLADLGTSGTALSGTICTMGSVFTAANGSVSVGAPGGYFVDGGRYVGLVNGAGTIGTGAIVGLTLAYGR